MPSLHRDKALQLKCHEAENLYLADEVLHRLGTTWESAIERIEAQAADFGEKSERLSACRTWNREEADVKDVVKILPQILDEKTVPWAVRVGQVLGAGRPTGQLAEFLGDEVVSSLLGPPKRLQRSFMIS